MLAYTVYPIDARVRREAEALTERGDEVDLICIRWGDQEKHSKISGVRVLRLSMRRYQGSSNLRYFMNYLKFFILSFLKLSYLYVKNRYQIIQVHTMPDFLVFAAIIPKLFRAKIILDVHDLMPELYMSKFHVDGDNLLIKFITFL